MGKTKHVSRNEKTRDDVRYRRPFELFSYLVSALIGRNRTPANLALRESSDCDIRIYVSEL